jgi:hypothetical protein
MLLTKGYSINLLPESVVAEILMGNRVQEEEN